MKTYKIAGKSTVSVQRDGKAVTFKSGAEVELTDDEAKDVIGYAGEDGLKLIGEASKPKGGKPKGGKSETPESGEAPKASDEV